MNFEWDEAKRVINLARHGIDFEKAIELFDGRPLLSVPGTYRDEVRHLAIGLLEGRLVAAVWTWRGEYIRLISVRSARHGERRNYHAHHAG
jgi:uncharacterized protein